MAKRLNVRDYDWAMYVDASGDDGFVFDRGSSSTYTVNCFMCETSEIDYNKEILREIKAVVRCDPNTEMKSSTIIKSKKRSEICDVLAKLHGMIFQMVIFKRYIDGSSMTKEEREKHLFSTIVHTFTIDMAASFHMHFQKSVCIIVDNMKSTEVVGTRESVNAALQDVKHAIIFADSKSTEHSLIQISDYFAGLTNKACAVHEEWVREDGSRNRCPVCHVRRNLCRNRPWILQTELFFDIQRYVNLFSVFSDRQINTVMGNGIRMVPLRHTERYQFFDCVMWRWMRKNK